MDTITRLSNPRNTRISLAVTLAAFGGYLAVPDSLRILLLALMTLGAAAVVALSLDGMRRRQGATAVSAMAAACAVGLVGSVAHLRSLADDPTAIPLVGVFVLFVSLVGLGVSLFTVRTR
jgi:hypothetical protein